MSSGAESRDRILGRVRSALQGRAVVPHPGAAPLVRPEGVAGAGSRVERFADALRQSGGEVVAASDLAFARSWLAELAGAFASAAVSPDVPGALRPALPDAEPALAELGVSVARAGAAATGSLLLASTEGRALQLLPPVHVVWIEERRIHEELSEALEAARAEGPLPAALALHSGPSKSADIGRILVTGVHGPGRLVAVVTGFSLTV